MFSSLKALVARLPKRWQQSLKRSFFARQIRANRFRIEEPEFELLHNYISPGDWVVDIGANIGHYTVRFSKLVGARGRVIAFEPVPETFELLASNVSLLPCKNVSLFNAAASERAGLAGMDIPLFTTGMANNYLAHLTDSEAGLQVLCIPFDGLGLAQRVRLVKIDAEGHELSVLRGMTSLLERDSPVLIVEDNSPEATEFLRELGYTSQKLPGSCNCVFQKTLINTPVMPQEAGAPQPLAVPRAV